MHHSKEPAARPAVWAGGFAAALAAVAALASAPEAHAGLIVLAPTAVIFDPAQSFITLTAPGVYHFVPPGTNAPTDATALFGPDPSISLSFSSDGGDAELILTYQIDLVPLTPSNTPPDPYAANVAVPVVMSDTVTAPGNADPYDGRADAQIKIFYNQFQPLDMENCAGNTQDGCSYVGPFTTTPFASVTSVDLAPGIPYTVLLRADIAQSGFATIDPKFTAPAGYSLVYSPGVLGAPEPAAWALMLLGVGAVGGSMRRSRRFMPGRA